MTAIFVKSVRTAPIAIFQFRIRGCIRFVAVAFQSEEEALWRRNPSLTYFWQIASPPPGSALGWSLPKSLYKQVRDYEYFISIKFCKHPSSGSVGKAEEEVFWRRNPSLTYFWQIAPLDPPLGEFAEKPINRCVIMSTSSIKFRKHPSSGSVGKAD